MAKGEKPHTVITISESNIDDECDTDSEKEEDSDDDRIVYCILNATTGLLKIGVTADLQRRIAGLRTQSGCHLEVIGTAEAGGRTLEAELHRKFKKHRVVGEWFKDTPEIRDVFSPITMDDMRRAVDALILPRT